MPSVFISYSHDPSDITHAERVAGLAASLLEDGLEVFFDQDRGDEEEEIPWAIWMEDKIEVADYVLLVCTELYLKKVRQKVAAGEGRGVCWEANLIYNVLYRLKRNTTKFVPVVFSLGRKFYPTAFARGAVVCFDPNEGYVQLYAFLTGQHRLLVPGTGRRRCCRSQRTSCLVRCAPGRHPAGTAGSVFAPNKPVDGSSAAHAQAECPTHSPAGPPWA